MGGEPYVVMIPFPGDLGETIEPVEWKCEATTAYWSSW
jgi:hypothetical protein